MVSLLGPERVLLIFSWMSFEVSFAILQGLVVLCLMALYLCVIVLLVLLIALRLGGYLFLVRLVV